MVAQAGVRCKLEVQLVALLAAAATPESAADRSHCNPLSSLLPYLTPQAASLTTFCIKFLPKRVFLFWKELLFYHWVLAMCSFLQCSGLRLTRPSCLDYDIKFLVFVSPLSGQDLGFLKTSIWFMCIQSTIIILSCNTFFQLQGWTNWNMLWNRDRGHIGDLSW